MNLKLCIYFLLCFLLMSQKKLFNKQKRTVNISFAIINKFIHNIFIPLSSLLKNSDRDTIYQIYFLVEENFDQKNSELLYNLEKIYFNCFIHIINIKDDFKDAFRKQYFDEVTYFKLKLPNIEKDINRIIYLDIDIVVLKDLTQLYTLNFENKFILGRLDKNTNELDKLNLYITNYISCGVLLLDLYSLRKYKYEDKFMEYIKMNNNQKYLPSHDKTVINYICHDKIGILKPIFHMWPYKDINKYIEDNHKLRMPYDISDIYKSFYEPFIIHFPGDYKFKIELINELFYKILYEYIILSVKTRLSLEKMVTNDTNLTENISSLLS